MSCATETYTLGESLRVEATFTDGDGAAVDPTVTAWVINPAGVQTSLTPVDETGTGIWSALYTTDPEEDAAGVYEIFIKGVRSGETRIGSHKFPVVS